MSYTIALVEDDDLLRANYTKALEREGYLVSSSPMAEDSRIVTPEREEPRIQGMWVVDKLIENGVSFHTETTPIEIILVEKNGAILLQVANQGPTIPQDRQNQIFNSMVSFRRLVDYPFLGPYQ